MSVLYDLCSLSVCLSRSISLVFVFLELGLGFAWILSLALDSTGATHSFVCVQEFVCWVIVTVVFFLLYNQAADRYLCGNPRKAEVFPLFSYWIFFFFSFDLVFLMFFVDTFSSTFVLWCRR
jgi:hypothetical protein